MKANDLKGRAVVTLQEAEKIGTVGTLIYDIATSRVLGLKIKTGLFSGDRYVRSSDIRSVGDDAVTIPDKAKLYEKVEEVSELKGQPDTEDIERIKAVSESGTLIGAIEDILVDMQTFRITAYQLDSSIWQSITGHPRTFDAPQAGMRFGRGLLIVPDDIAAKLINSKSVPATTEAPATSDITTPPATGDTGYGAATTAGSPYDTSASTTPTTWGSGDTTNEAPATTPSGSSTTVYPASAADSLSTNTGSVASDETSGVSARVRPTTSSLGNLDEPDTTNGQQGGRSTGTV